MTEQEVLSKMQTILGDILDSISEKHPEGMTYRYHQEAFTDVMKPILNGRTQGEYIRTVSGFICEVIFSKEVVRVREKMVDTELLRLFTSVLSEWQYELLNRARHRCRQLRELRAEGQGLEQSLKRAKQTYLSELRKWQRTYEDLSILLNNYRQWDRLQAVLSHVDRFGADETVARTSLEEFAAWLTFSPSTIRTAIRSAEMAKSRAIVFDIQPVDQDTDTQPNTDVRSARDETDGDPIAGSYVQLQMRYITVEDMLDNIRASMILRAWDQYGYDGQTIMRLMLNDSWIRSTDMNVDQGGRPRQQFKTKFCLWLDRYLIPRKYIGMLLTTIEGRDAMDPIAEAKRVGQRIRTNGGNTLRFIADQYIRNFGRCTDCVWGWNKAGILTRVDACDKHDQPIDEESIQFSIREGNSVPQTDDWLNEMLGLRPEGDYANALAWHLSTATKPSPK